MFKMSHIRKYIEGISREEFTDFEYLLIDYLNKDIIGSLSELGLKKISCHIDWFDDVKILAIQSKYKDYFVEFQVDQKEISFAYDKDEPENSVFYCVQKRNNNKEFYSFLGAMLKDIRRNSDE